MPPRYRIVFRGVPSSRLVRWMQALIPVLREAPRDVEVCVEIKPAPDPDDSGRDEAA